MHAEASGAQGPRLGLELLEVRRTDPTDNADGAGTEPTAQGGTVAAPAALGRQAAAAAPTTQPDRPAHARRPAPALLTPPMSQTDQTFQATASQQPSPEPTAPMRSPCRPEE
jgi:hypothetical protein